MTPGAPPPSTPDPRRFLLSRRAPAASQQETPASRQFQTSGGTSSSSSQRFLTTPRFAPASSSYTPKPPSSTQGFLLPGQIRSTQRKHREPIHDDVLDSSPAAESSPVPIVKGDPRGSIDLESEPDSGPRSPPIVADSYGEEYERDGPTPKRRRTELSSVRDEDSNEGIEQGSYAADDGFVDEEVSASPSARRMSPGTEPAGEGILLDAPTSPLVQNWEEDMDLSDLENRRATDAQQQPMFQRAPRFVRTEKEETIPDSLPEAFSPQRSGAKYVPGGLAAEMQSWLADVRGWTGHDRPPDAVMRIVIDEVRPGNRMYLVHARRMSRARNEGDAGEETAEPILRIMLAGEGKLTGLSRNVKAAVVEGSIVVISQPVWEVTLDDGRWVVACEWAVESRNDT